MKIVIASDREGYSLKKTILDTLTAVGLDVTDAGSNSPGFPVDYVDLARTVSKSVASGEYDRGILICGSGIGMSIVANRIPGIRAGTCHDIYTARYSRAHNDANILCMGSFTVTKQHAEQIVTEWLGTPFDGGHYGLQLAKLDLEAERHDIEVETSLRGSDLKNCNFAFAISPRPTRFGPLLFPGRLEDGLRAASNLGFQAVELSLASPEDLDVMMLQSMLEDRNLMVAAFATGQACLDEGLCLSSAKDKVRNAAVNRLKSIIGLAKQFNASVIIGGIRGSLSGTIREQTHQRRSAIKSIRECAKFATDSNVTLLIEPINRYETNFINTASEGLELLEEIDEPSLKLLLDTFHMNIEESNIVATLKSVAGHLGYIHISDSNRKAPGQGHIDFASVFNTLSELGYQGFVTAEILPLPDDVQAARQTSEYLNLVEKVEISEIEA